MTAANFVSKCYELNTPKFKEFFPFQEDLIKVVEENNYVLINQARQMGVSTLVMNYIHWLTNCNEDKSVLILSSSKLDSISKLDTLKESRPYLGEIKCDTVHDTKVLLEMSNGSKIEASFVLPNSIKGKSFDLIFVDNASFITNLEDVIDVIFSLLKTGGKLVISSCLHKEGWFSKEAMSAEKEESQFKYVKIPYYKRPDRNRLFRLHQDKVLGENTAKIEYDCTHILTEDGLKPLIEF